MCLPFIYVKKLWKMKHFNYIVNSEQDDLVGDFSGINMVCKELTSKLIVDCYSSLSQSLVTGGKHWYLCLLNNMYNQMFT